MKLSLFRSALMAAGFTALFAIAASAQNEPMTGAYGEMSVKSKEARQVAALAVRQHSATHKRDKVTLVKILKAEQQVVAGLNYRLCMLVKTKRGVQRTVTAVVYQPIRGRKRLTDWETGGCREI